MLLTECSQIGSAHIFLKLCLMNSRQMIFKQGLDAYWILYLTVILIKSTSHFLSIHSTVFQRRQVWLQIFGHLLFILMWTALVLLTTYNDYLWLILVYIWTFIIHICFSLLDVYIDFENVKSDVKFCEERFTF